MAEESGYIVKVSGPTVIAENIPNVRMLDIVEVGERSFIGEVIRLDGNRAFIQVYEDSIRPSEPGEVVRQLFVCAFFWWWLILASNVVWAVEWRLEKDLHTLKDECSTLVLGNINVLVWLTI